MQNLSTCLWFDEQAQDAVAFSAMMTMSRIDMEGVQRAYDGA